MPRLGISAAPRTLTRSELEWLRREGSEFQEQYLAIRAQVLAVRDMSERDRPSQER
jgi:hypothetical protein